MNFSKKLKKKKATLTQGLSNGLTRRILVLFVSIFCVLAYYWIDRHMVTHESMPIIMELIYLVAETKSWFNNQNGKFTMLLNKLPFT